MPGLPAPWLSPGRGNPADGKTVPAGSTSAGCSGRLETTGDRYLMSDGRKLQPRASPPRGREGKRLYAIGDVHGCLAELTQLMAMISQDHASRPPKDCHVVFLGDLIDRGPGSRDVIAYLRREVPRFARFHFVRGNHEEMMIRALSGEPALIPGWLQHGGLACALSYGVDPGDLMRDSDPSRLEQILRACIPREDVAFLDRSVDMIRFGDYALVHAGVRPGIALDAQTARDLRWIRGEFLDSDQEHGAVIVHGHTIREDVERRHNRIGLDTGAYLTGRLTALRLEGEERAILSTGNHTDSGIMKSPYPDYDWLFEP